MVSRDESIRHAGRPSINAGATACGLGRGIIALIGIVSVFVLMVFGFSDPPMGGYTAQELMILVTALAIFAVSILGRLWMLIDHAHRTLFDRLLGLVVSVPSGTTRIQRDAHDSVTED
jgi:hypothetical protein